MTTGRRAQQFHDLVEHGSPSDGSLPEYAELHKVVGALRAVPDPIADPAFIAALRDRLVAEAETVLAAAAAGLDDSDTRLRQRPAAAKTRRRHRRLAAVISGLALVGATATMAVASQDALPGDGLYPVKRGLESAHAELTLDRGDRGRVVLASARTRLDEAQTLSRTHADASRVSEALDAFTDQTSAGSDLLVSDYEATGNRSSITALRTFAVASMRELDRLQSEAPAAAFDPLRRAAQTVDEVQQTSVRACSVCDGPILGVPGALAQVTHATLDAWHIAPAPAHHAHQHVVRAPDGGPIQPHVTKQRPPASVSVPNRPTATQSPSAQTSDDDSRHTVRHLTDALTHHHRDGVTSSVADTADDVLDAVGQAADQVTGTVGDTVAGLLDGLLGSPSP